MQTLAKWLAASRGRAVVVLAFFALAAVPRPAAAQSGLFVPTGTLNTARYSHTATQLPDGKVLIAGGNTTESASASAERYDPVAGTFTATGSLLQGRSEHTATLLPNGKVLIVGGWAMFPGALWTTGSAELYDPATGTFTATGSMAATRRGHTATLLPNGQVLVAGGTSGPTPLATAELYDPEAGVFTGTGGTMGTARAQHTATLLPNGKVLIAGGYPMTAGAELYDPADRRGGSFTPTGSMNTPRQLHTATLLPNGKVLVAGTYPRYGTSEPLTARVELYDPAAGTFTAAGNMTMARSGPTATLLPGGKVLIAGGDGYNDFGMIVPVASAELYDPLTGTSSGTGSMSTTRAYFTATLLSTTGKVLVAAGYPYADSRGTASADLFAEVQPCY